jgi:hypothetical protein
MRKIDLKRKEELESQLPSEFIDNLGPKKMFNLKLYADLGDGYRTGYTKQTIDKRRKERRAKNKLVRKARRQTRLKNR